MVGWRRHRPDPLRPPGPVNVDGEVGDSPVLHRGAERGVNLLCRGCTDRPGAMEPEFIACKYFDWTCVLAFAPTGW
jgi:hypothetical protein